MRKATFVALLLIMLSVLPVHAQDDDYRLRVPSAEEYLVTIPAALDYLPEMPGASTASIAEAMLFEMRQTYSDAEIFAQDFNLLSHFYEALTFSKTRQNPIVDPVTWGAAMLRAWLRDHPTDLAQVERLEVPGYWITVQPFDLNHDGIDEYGLHVSFDAFSAYLVLQRDSEDVTGYRFVETPLSWLDQLFPISFGLPSDYEDVHFGDVTGDALPEWLVFAGSTYDGCGHLYMLTWEDGALVDLAPDDARFCYADAFTIADVDGDPALEVVQTETRHDNWQCEWSVTHRLDWNGTRFERLDESPIYHEALGCALHQAEPLMWENRVGEAIRLYEAGLTAGWDAPTDDNPVYFAELERYARARLALAYALDGRIAESHALLADLMAETSTSAAIDAMIAAMSEADTALDICVAAYNVWAEYAVSAFNYSTLPITAEIGREGFIGGLMDDYPPKPERAGCDAPQLIDTLLQSHTFTTEQSPPAQLAALGIAVLDTFSVDFDADGADEWIVWLEARVPPILLAPEAGRYVLSRPPLRRPNDVTSFSVQPIPGQGGLLLVDYAALDFAATNVEYYTYDVEMVYCDEVAIRSDGANQGEVRLWRLGNGEFERVFAAPVCQTQPLEALFTDNGAQLHAAAVTRPVEPAYDSRYGDVLYTWDPAAQTYTPSAVASDAAAMIPDATSAPGDADMTDFLVTLTDTVDYLRDGHREAALTLVESVLADADSSAAPVVLHGLHYFRALALEALGRPDEALAEYVALSRSSPKSGWSLLAAIHIEGTTE
ncbi:MAG: hypothetical protein IT320_04930 [Anaerolineae bacterium]|nr:hypothetical protein [Anaerolineae bacterium]